MSSLKEVLIEFNGNEGASAEAIEAAERHLKVIFPDDYAAFLATTNGGEGKIGGTYVMLWSTTELPELNSAYQVADNAPGLLLIGSDGGGDAFAFDMRSSPWPVVSVPFVGMDLAFAEPMGASFQEFLEGFRDEFRRST
jgi:hypothetical protein